MVNQILMYALIALLEDVHERGGKIEIDDLAVTPALWFTDLGLKAESEPCALRHFLNKVIEIRNQQLSSLFK